MSVKNSTSNMDSPIVVNKYKESYDVYIGRGSVWGNPFKITPELSREDCIEKYRKFLWLKIKEGNITRSDVESLRGKRLGCFCKPKACHGDILVSLYKNRNKVFGDDL